MSNQIPAHRMTDHLLGTAFAFPELLIAERTEEHEQAKRAIGSLLLDDWESDDRLAAHALHAAIGFACSPSTEYVVLSKTHDRDVAEEVGTNMSDLASYILDTPGLDTDTIEQRRTFKTLTGLMTEIAVLGALWKGVECGYRDEKQYALPATHAQDASRVVNGYYTGVDIVLRQSGAPKQKGYIQVKNSPNYSPLNEVSKQYRPGIAVVTPATLLDNPNAIGYTLLEAVASNDEIALKRANRNADTILMAAARHKRQLRYPYLDVAA